MRNTLCTFGAGLLAGVALNTAIAQTTESSPVRRPGTVPVKQAPPGTARVHLLAADAQSAFVGLLEIDAGAQVPEHQDESEEFVYVLNGGGEITVDGQTHSVQSGDLVYMPANATVSFVASEDGPTQVLQIFAPATSAAKYNAWQ